MFFLKVHRATLLDGRKVAIKIQYPGVAHGIDSDIDNLINIMNYTNFLPRGLFLQNFADVRIFNLANVSTLLRALHFSSRWATVYFLRPHCKNFKAIRQELKLECDYKREARSMKVFRYLLRNDSEFYIPEVYLSSAEFIS